MANNPHVSAASRDLGLNAAFDVLNSGKLRWYDGTQPTNTDTAIGAQVKLAELALSATAFAAAASGSKTANAIATDPAADAAGIVSWHTLVKSDGTTRVFDGSAGVGAFDLSVNQVAVALNAVVSCVSYVFSQAA